MTPEEIKEESEVYALKKYGPYEDKPHLSVRDMLHSDCEEHFIAGAEYALSQSSEGSYVSDQHLIESLRNTISILTKDVANKHSQLERLKVEHKEMKDALQQILELCDNANMSSFNQIKEAVRGSIEISDSLITKIESNGK